MFDPLFLGVPFHAGQTRKGVSLAPDLFRSVNADIFTPRGWQDLGDVAAPAYSGRSAAIDHARELSNTIAGLDLSDRQLFLMGGDHGQGLGSVHGLLHHYPNMIVIWIDAHADVNVPSSSPTGNMHGMPLSWLLGAQEGKPWWVSKTIRPQQLLYIGVRDVDPFERMLLEELDIAWITPEEVHGPTFKHILNRELNRLDPQKKSPVHLSFDVDAIDSNLIQATGTRVSGGIHPTHIEQVFSWVASERRVVSSEIVEINPELGEKKEAIELCRWSRELFQSVMPIASPKKSSWPAMFRVFHP